jgi:hypothetical protein
VLKSHAHVVGDIHHQRLSIEPGAHFEGRSVCSLKTSVQKAPEKLTTRMRKAMELKATREPVDGAALLSEALRLAEGVTASGDGGRQGRGVAESGAEPTP